MSYAICNQYRFDGVRLTWTELAVRALVRLDLQHNACVLLDCDHYDSFCAKLVINNAMKPSKCCKALIMFFG